jgi:hypothetical protein
MTRISPRKVWLPAALLAFLGLIAWWGASGTLSYRSALNCCAFDPGTGGGLGLVLWARQMGIPVRSLEDPLWEAVASPELREGNCFLTAGNGSWSPWHEEQTREEWAPIRQWIARGNALVVITTDPSTLPKAFIDDLFPSTAGSFAKPAQANTASRGEEEPSLFRSVVPANPPTSAVVLPGNQSLTVRADGPRWSKSVTGGESATAADVKGVVWLRKPVGKGAVYVLLDDFAWTNSGFDGAGNANALAAVLSQELRKGSGSVGQQGQGGVFAFDEYRHGHGRVESFAAYLMKLPGGNAFFLMALVLGGVYLLGKNVRFGPPETFVQLERRTAREYVEAAAFLNERARAAPLAVESILRRVRAIGARRGHSSVEMDELLFRAERFVATGERPANPSEVCVLVRRIIALRKKLYGS